MLNKTLPFLVPSVQLPCRDSGRFGSLRDRQAIAFVEYVNAAPAVVYLFMSSGPLAVLRGIGAVIVDALNGVLWAGLPAHVSNEGVKRIRPSFAHEDAATAVVLECLVRWIRTTLAHVHPRYLLRGIGQAVSGFALGYASVVFASAAKGLPASKVADVGDALSAADTSAENLSQASFSKAWRKRRPVPKSFTNSYGLSEHLSALICKFIQHTGVRYFMTEGAR